MRGRGFLIFLFLFSVSTVYAQSIHSSIYLGGNLSQVDGDQLYGFHKVGLCAGISANIAIHPSFFVEIENQYTQKGSYASGVDAFLDAPDSGAYHLKLNYIEVPLWIRYKDPRDVLFGIGVSWGRLVFVEEFESNKQVKQTTLLSGVYDRADWNILVGVEIPVYKKVFASIRYAYSLDMIREKYFMDVVRKQYNQVLSMSFRWRFME